MALRASRRCWCPRAPVAEPVRTRLYTVRKGETLVTISDRFGVSLNQLRRWNKITGIKVQPGQRLHVADPASCSPHRRSRAARAAGSPAAAHSAAPRRPTAKPPRPLRKKRAPVNQRLHTPLLAAKKTGTANAKSIPRKEIRRASAGRTRQNNIFRKLHFVLVN